MAVINNPDLREIAYRIMSEPGFSTDGEGLLRAHKRWTELTRPEQRLAAERALFARWLQDLRADRDRPPERFSIPDARDPRPRIVPATVEDDDPQPVPEQARPGSELKFRSESPDWRDADAAADDFPGGQPESDTHASVAAGDQAPVLSVARRRQDPPRRPEPVTVTNIAVQQPSRKIAAYQQMFPELTFPVQTASGAKPGTEFDRLDIAYRRSVLAELRQEWRTANAGDEARIEDWEHRIAEKRVRVAERGQHIRDNQAEDERWAKADRELAESGVALVGELPPEVLAACGFKRRVA
jgi:hypothetical protein